MYCLRMNKNSKFPKLCVFSFFHLVRKNYKTSFSKVKKTLKNLKLTIPVFVASVKIFGFDFCYFRKMLENFLNATVHVAERKL